jgi:lipoprotein signal peptidase
VGGVHVEQFTDKHVEQFTDINKLFNVASCWIYIGIILGAHPILHISRIRVKDTLPGFL